MQDHKNGLQALEEPRLKKSCWGHTVQMRIDTTTHTHTPIHTLCLSLLLQGMRDESGPTAPDAPLITSGAVKAKLRLLAGKET